jgi:transcriptional regulator with XRE-family HTH domain
MALGENVRRHREAAGLSQQQLAKRVGMTQSSIALIESGDTARTRFLPQLAAALNVNIHDLDPSLAPPGPGGGTVTTITTPGNDFPIYASAEGGEGTIILSTDPVDFMPRPAPLAHVRNSYGLYLTGDSMVPEFWPGEVAMVNPVLPIIAQVPAILYTEKHGEARATIKRIEKATADTWHLRQWNPPTGKRETFTLPRKDWAVAHRVIGKYTRS